LDSNNDLKNIFPMKKFLRIFITLLLFITSVSHAQWTLLPTFGIAELRAAYFFNSQEGLVVGSDSLMRKTTDAGLTWTPVQSYADTLRSIYFTDDSTGYAVGAKGTIIKSTDRGNTWIAQVSGVTSLLRSVHFPSADTGYVAGGNGTILKTTDGGNSWIAQASGTTQDLISIRFTNADTGYAVSSLATFFNGIIFKTVNGGQNWDTVYTNSNGFLSVFPVTGDIVYAAGDSGTIVKTIDGGVSWDTLVTGDKNRLRACFFLTPDSGYVAGELGSLFFTADGGLTWINQSSQTAGLLGLYFPMSDTGYAVGNAATILRYSKPCPQASEPAQIFGGTTVCVGDTLNYYIAPVANANSYTWTGPPGSTVTSGQGDTLVSIVFSGSSGNISVTADNVCGASPPHLLTVIVNALPPVPIISTNGLYLVTGGASAWQWYLNGSIIAGADTSQFIPLQNGTYSVSVTNNFGCTSSSVPFSVLNAAVAEINKTNLKIIPSPFSDDFTISFNSEFKEAETMIIYSTEGRMLQQILLTEPKFMVDARKLASGIYFYVIMNDQDQINFRGKLMKTYKPDR
jgi:photosystem II stability/assembly factor-like uncharacterized protein